MGNLMSNVFRHLGLESQAVDAQGRDAVSPNTGQEYWWSTSGQDIANMLEEAQYPEEVKKQFLNFYRTTICPRLGTRPDVNSTKSEIGWDGNPFEYSWEIKGSTKQQGVRFVVDLSPLRPANTASPLSITTTQKMVDMLAKTTPMFDDIWYRALVQAFVYSHLPTAEQEALVRKVGYQTAVTIGFDIHPKILPSGQLPVMAKVYFPLCFAAAVKGINRWQAMRLAIRELPDIGSYPNILQSLGLIEDYLSDKPESFQHGARGISSDFLVPGKARLKIYMRSPVDSFEEVWDYYTLGGRIPDVEEDKELFRDLVEYTCGNKKQNYKQPNRKHTAIYFSLSPASPYPEPKIYIYPANYQPHDEAIAKGVDAWLEKHKWDDCEKSFSDQVKRSFTHRKLDENTGLFTFIGFGKKQDPSKKALSLQVYVTPELYLNPRC